MNLDAFFKLSYGLYIVSSADGDKMNGHISNTVFQVTAEPPRFAIATNKDNLTSDYIIKSKVFSISVLEQNVDLEFLGPWGFKSGKELDKFATANYTVKQTGAPIVLDKTIAWFECKVVDSMDTGTHILFIGELVNYELVQENATPLTYDYYRSVIKGISPKNAPTYLGDYEEKKYQAEDQATPDKQLYQCIVCGFIYDPEIGDPDGGIPPGTAFEDIPDDWMCPVCGVTKKDFRPMDA